MRRVGSMQALILNLTGKSPIFYVNIGIKIVFLQNFFRTARLV